MLVCSLQDKLFLNNPPAMEACFPETIQMDSVQFSAFMQELAAGR